MNVYDFVLKVSYLFIYFVNLSCVCLWYNLLMVIYFSYKVIKHCDKVVTINYDNQCSFYFRLHILTALGPAAVWRSGSGSWSMNTIVSTNLVPAVNMFLFWKFTISSLD